jgi:HK97 family phage portal protein
MSISDFDSILDMIAGGGAPSYTGKLVGPASAMGVSAFWGCVNVLADDFATLPMEAYQWIEPGVSRSQARDHYLWPLFTEEANPRMSSHRFKRQMETWRNVWGNCYAEIETNGRGQVIALWPWHPDRVKVWLETPGDVRSEVYYSYVPSDRTKKPITLSSDHILHVRGTSINGITGMSPIEVHRQTLALGMAMQEHSGRFYGNGATIKGVLQHPGKLSPKAEASLRESLDKYKGLSNSHRMMILEEGMTFAQSAMPLKDAQYIESENLNGENIARIMKVPQHRIGLLARSTNNNIVQQSMEYVQYSLGPNAANWVSEVHCSLLSARERNSVFLVPDYNYLLAGDPATRAALYTVLANTGAFSPDDIRHGEGKNPLSGGIGKTPRTSLNTAPLDSEAAKNPQSKSGGDAKPDLKPGAAVHPSHLAYQQ